MVFGSAFIPLVINYISRSFTIYRVEFLAYIDLACAWVNKVILAKSFNRIRSCKNWNEMVLFAEANKLRTVLLINGCNFINEQRNAVFVVIYCKPVDDIHDDHKPDHFICSIAFNLLAQVHLLCMALAREVQVDVEE